MDSNFPLMPRHLLSLLTVSLVIVACSGSGETTANAQPTRPRVTTTSTSTIPTTTTTTVPFVVADAPKPLSTLVEDFYAFATGQSEAEPAAPRPVVSAMSGTQADIPHDGKASVGSFKNRPIAVVKMNRDIFLAVKNDEGWRIVGGRWPSLGIPAFFGRSPRLVAVVGSDARPGQDVDGTRADSIHLVGLDGEGSGALVGVPRDSWVGVPGYGNKKINASLSLGGPETMMAAFDDLTGLPLEGYVITGFAGFRELLGSVLGGVEVDVPFSINDRWAHVALSAGTQMLNGAEALGFARARKTVPGGDFTRSEHQGVVLLSAARTVQAMGFLALPGLIEASEEHLVTDLGPGQLLTFAAMVMSADIDSVANVVAPGRPGSAGAASVVYLADSASDLWADLADGVLTD